jgi:hypothetical protein
LVPVVVQYYAVASGDLHLLRHLQVALPHWPGRLPPGLTQLAVSAPALNIYDRDSDARAESYFNFCQLHLPALRGLRHLAFDSLPEIGALHLHSICTSAGALPQLISLHLVRS